MRHRKKFNHLSRTSSHRKAMLSNMATSLILHKRITTTTAKAKALRSYVEPLITRSKEDTTHSRRMVFSYLQSKEAVTELFREVSTKVAERPGGYTRIIKTGNRLGDNADMCLIELVDYNEHLLASSADAEKKTTGRRRRRKSGGAKEQPEAKVQQKVTQPSTEEVKPAEKEAVVETEEVAVENVTEVETPKVEETKVETEVAATEEEKTEVVATKEEKPEPEAGKADEDDKASDDNTEKKA